MKRIDLIVNRLRVDMVKRGEMMTVDDVTDILAVNLIVPCRMMSRSLFPQTVVSHWLEPTVWQGKHIPIFATVLWEKKFHS